MIGFVDTNQEHGDSSVALWTCLSPRSVCDGNGSTFSLLVGIGLVLDPKNCTCRLSLSLFQQRVNH